MPWFLGFFQPFFPCVPLPPRVSSHLLDFFVRFIPLVHGCWYLLTFFRCVPSTPSNPSFFDPDVLFFLLSFSSFVGFLRCLWFLSWSFSCFMSSIVTSPSPPPPCQWDLGVLIWLCTCSLELRSACLPFLPSLLPLAFSFLRGGSKKTFPVQSIQLVGIFQCKYSVSTGIPSTKYSASRDIHSTQC